MLKKSLISMGACALSLSSNICVAADIVSGYELTNVTVSGGDFLEEDGGATLGIGNIYDYWNGNPEGDARVITPYGFNVNTNIDLGVNGGNQLEIQGTGTSRINANITGSVIAGEGGSLMIGASLLDASGGLTAVYLGETGYGSFYDLDSIDVNAQLFQIESSGTVTLGEGDSLTHWRRWIYESGGLGESPDSTAFVNKGSVEQLGAGSLVDIHGVFVIDGSYELQGGTLKVEKNAFLNSDSFRQYAGTSNIIQGYLDISGTYNMYGGQLTAESIRESGNGFNYVDGGVFVRNQDVEIRSGGLLNKNLVMDAGERFGSRNLIVGTDIADSGSVTIDGGTNTVSENLTINAGGSVVHNSGSNSIGDHLVIESGGSYTMNGGQLTADHITGSASSPAYYLWVSAFNYVDGGVWLKTASIDIRSPGLFGDTLLIDESDETFGALNMLVGDSTTDSGSINQTTGKNLISNELTIGAGGRYDMSGGRLEFGSFAGPGKINFTGGEIYAGSDMNIGAGGALGESVVLDANKTLSLQAEGDYGKPRNDLTIDAGADLTLDGGMLIANRINKTGEFNYVSGRLDLNTLTFGDTGLFGDFTVTNDDSLYVRNDVTIEAGTTVTVESGNISGGAAITNNGNLVLNGGTLSTSQINNVGAGSFDFTKGSLAVDTLEVGNTGLLGSTVVLDSTKSINAGTVNVSTGSRLEVNGGTSSVSSLTNDGDVVIDQAGQLNGGTYTQDSATAATTVNGSLNADVVMTDGKLNGSGTINGDAINDGGDVGPGQSPGVLHVTGDFSQTEFGILNIEIGGLLSGDEYDVLSIDGTANLGGTLDVDLYNLGGGLFAPGLGDTFDFLTAETITGDFDLLTLMALGDGLDWQLDYLYDEIGTDIARLSVVEASVVPVPAAIWLFGSGLIGLIGIARRKKA